MSARSAPLISLADAQRRFLRGQPLPPPDLHYRRIWKPSQAQELEAQSQSHQEPGRSRC